MADVLNKADAQSAVWIKLSTHLNNQLTTLRIRNDQLRTPEETAFLRGQIDGFKQILALAEPRQGPPEPDA